MLLSHLTRNLRFNSGATWCRKFSRTVLALNDTKNVSKYAMFFDKRVQHILTDITGRDEEKIYRPRYRDTAKPTYRLVTDKELEKLKSDAEEKIQKTLQIPPVLDEKPDVNVILSKDEALAEHDQFNYVFTDISYNIPHEKRTVTVREKDGTLRLATNDEHKRMIQVYFPGEGRKHYMPNMFTEKHLERLLEEGEYEYILDRACVQFDPDETDYIRVTRRVYEYIADRSDFMKLYSTRHFGAAAFFLTVQKNIDSFIAVLINSNLLHSAKSLIDVYYMVHNQEQGLPKEWSNLSDEEAIMMFAKQEAKDGSRIELALQVYKENVEREMSS
ncbi:DgyrCDS2453 [Dimorphilus gyrociliatus]|uniref:DgyrCDS2453 n=1 Tax=Dimorphilus gyrociliatus TaxID=2664684 RepID=A0A7I8VAJ8_9ANNE|nr:DgyrCDS2453 [Dimorphilus gyrociliatus]